MMRYTYPKSHRLLTPKDYKRVFDETTYKAHQPHLMAFVAKSDGIYPRLGLAITKKKSPKAVSRNLIKRLIKERFRHYAPQMQKMDMVFILKKSPKDLDNKELFYQIDAVFKKIINKQQ